MPNMLWRPGQHTRNGACALLFALLLSCAAAAAATEAAASEDVTPTEQTPSEAEPAVAAKPVPENIRNLLLWILQNDGIVDLEVGEVDERGLRGVKAVRDMVEGQVAVKIPRVLGAVMGDWNRTSEENAIALLKRKTVEDWNVAMGPYWDSLPKPEELMTKEWMPPAALPLLQDSTMPAFVRIHQDFMRTVLRGGKPLIVKDLRAHLGRDVGLEEFKYWTALVASYSFTFPGDDNEQQVRVMLPLMDLFNHANADSANINMFRDENGDYYGYAKRPIAKGEQLRHSYNGGCERNDHSLFHYGFVQDLDPPRLAALDLPEGNLYDEAAFSEKDYEPGGSLWNAGELERLSGILAAFPTTEAEDRLLLAGGSWLDKALGRQPLSGRFERLFVEFRMLRKRALQATIDKLRATLEAAKTEL